LICYGLPYSETITSILSCQHAFSVRINVVIDVVACRLQADNQAVDILNAIATKVPSYCWLDHAGPG
jgi:hypothetical protein